VFSQVPAEAVERALAQLGADLESGVWRERHKDLLELDELDLGYTLVTAEFG
jgi:hypothetical protein